MSKVEALAGLMQRRRSRRGQCIGGIDLTSNLDFSCRLVGYLD